MQNNFKVGRLGYNSELDRYGILISDLWEVEGLHCGNQIMINYNDEWINDRIEYNHSNKSWYLVKSNLIGEDLEGIKVKISN